MKVRDLVKALSDCPPDAAVVTVNGEYGGFDLVEGARPDKAVVTLVPARHEYEHDTRYYWPMDDQPDYKDRDNSVLFTYGVDHAKLACLLLAKLAVQLRGSLSGEHRCTQVSTLKSAGRSCGTLIATSGKLLTVSSFSPFPFSLSWPICCLVSLTQKSWGEQCQI